MNLIDLVKYVEENKNSAFLYTPKIYPDSRSFFIEKFTDSIVINDVPEIDAKLSKIDSEIEDGKTVISLINYEFGYLLEDRLHKLKNADSSCEFLISDNKFVSEILSSEIDYKGIEKYIGKKLVDDYNLHTEKSEYIKNVQKIKEYIQEGDTYQVNYTIQSSFDLVGSVSELFLQLIFSQSARYIAMVHLGDRYIISSSPELFFEITEDKITVKPMKGTIARGRNINEDELQKEKLRSSYKDQAENVMIIDLLRNDIGKICEYDSVKLSKQYEVEKYESIFQLTSTIDGKLRERKISSIIKNIFPSGSITGAPKLRTMEIINELENKSRGIYTGLIGIMNKDYAAANVAIRTISIDKKNKKAKLGIGSGIVWDSDPENEYEEVLLKSNFLTKPLAYFELFETTLIENGEVFLLDFHLKRLEKSAEYFLFSFDIKKITNIIKEKIAQLNETKKYKFRFSLSKWGKLTCEIEEIDSLKKTINVLLSEKRIDSNNRFQYFKTTNRILYNTELKKCKENGFDEVLFFNEKDKLAEGAFTNILVQIHGKVFTPTIESGILNGCYRQYLLESNQLIGEKEISREEFLSAEKIILINSVRKEMLVNHLFDENKKLIKKFN